MQTLLLWLLAAYGFASLWVSFCKWFIYARQKRSMRYLLYTYNSQGKIEWMIRYLAKLALLEGRSFRFIVYDFGSTDDTLAIIKYLSKSGLCIECISSFASSLEKVTLNRLVTQNESDFRVPSKLTQERNVSILGSDAEFQIIIDLRESVQSDMPSCG